MFAALAAGRWHSDTFGGKGRRDDGIEGKGFRAEMLDSVTASLFRAAFSADPKLRPTAAEFADHLNSILRNGRITFCPACRWPIIMELGRTHCVHSHHCGKPLPLPGTPPKPKSKILEPKLPNAQKPMGAMLAP